VLTHLFWLERREFVVVSKRILLSLAVSFLCVVAFIHAALAPTASVERIVNGGFESGDLTGWGNSGPPGVTVTSSSPHSGTYALRLEGDFATVNQTFSFAIKLASDLTFWARTETDSTGTLEIGILTPTMALAMSRALTNVWTQYTVGGAGEYINELVFSTHGILGASYPEAKLIDDVSALAVLPTIESCDWNGVAKDTFVPSDTVRVSGSGFPPKVKVAIEVVQHTNWVDGMKIPPLVTSSNVGDTTLSGELPVGPPPVAWWPPLTPGLYDIIVDVGIDGYYNASIDALAEFVVRDPRQFKMDAVTELNSARSLATKSNTVWEIDGAAYDIQMSLNPSYWTDDYHVNSLPVFYWERYAIARLTTILTSKVESASFMNTIQAIIGKLLKADDGLASTAIKDAKTLGSTKPTIILEITLADQAYYKATHASDSMYALDQFEMAWYDAETAIGLAK
jgi:hypothetical protein